jgi:ABC-type hemin transport system substrate-binding protein
MNHIQNIITQQSQTISLLLSSLLSSHPNTFLHLIRELQQLAQDVHTLQIQSNKRHEQMYAKLNHIASLVQTSLMETNAQRYATCTHLQQQLQQCTTMNQNKRQNFLLQIQQLKHDIQTITQERMKQDEEIVHMIVQHRTMLEQVMMLCLDL